MHISYICHHFQHVYCVVHVLSKHHQHKQGKEKKAQEKVRERERERVKLIGCVTLAEMVTLHFHLHVDIPYSGKFSYGAKFRIFRMLHPLYENKNCENLNV